MKWKSDLDAEAIDLTPMIDVVFLLVVFFMTVANMISAERYPVEVPVAPHAELPEDSAGRLTLTLTSRGRLFVGTQSCALEQLPNLLERFARTSAEPIVYLRADRATEHQYVGELLELCAAQGLRDVRFASYQSDK